MEQGLILQLLLKQNLKSLDINLGTFFIFNILSNQISKFLEILINTLPETFF